MTEQAPILTEEQWLHIKSNDDARTQAAISASREHEAMLSANVKFLRDQIPPMPHRLAIAVHAMQGVLSNPNIREILRDDDAFYERLVEVSFTAADAMIEKMEPKP